MAFKLEALRHSNKIYTKAEALLLFWQELETMEMDGEELLELMQQHSLDWDDYQ